MLQAEDYGVKLGKVTLSIDPATKTIISSDAALLDVVGAPIDPEVAALVAQAKANADELGKQPLGSITADIKRAVTPTGAEDRGSESVLGNFVADVQLAGTNDPGRGGAQIAFMNPGGLRADLLYAPDGVVTYSEAFSVQPFANDVVTQDLHGRADQAGAGGAVAAGRRVAAEAAPGVSQGLHLHLPAGQPGRATDHGR